MEKRTHIILLGWIEESLVASKDADFHAYEMKHWMEEETGIYVDEDEFKSGLLELGFEEFSDGYFHVKPSSQIGPVVIKKLYDECPEISWGEDKQKGFCERLLSRGHGRDKLSTREYLPE
jgi:hypothetical protein